MAVKEDEKYCRLQLESFCVMRDVFGRLLYTGVYLLLGCKGMRQAVEEIPLNVTAIKP